MCTQCVQALLQEKRLIEVNDSLWSVIRFSVTRKNSNLHQNQISVVHD